MRGRSVLLLVLVAADAFHYEECCNSTNSTFPDALNFSETVALFCPPNSTTLEEGSMNFTQCVPKNPEPEFPTALVVGVVVGGTVTVASVTVASLVYTNVINFSGFTVQPPNMFANVKIG